MILSSAFSAFFILLLSRIAPSTSQEHEQSARITFANVSEEKVALNWYDDNAKTFTNIGDLESGGGTISTTVIGHTFAYNVGGVEHEFIVENELSNVIIGPEEIRVECSTTEGDIRADIIPSWSPFGAARFLHLVRIGYYDGCAINRVVKGFLTQFGISSDYAARTEWRQENIADDILAGTVPFSPGFLSYAGSGPSSRSTEIFIAMPDAPEDQLRYFGTNPWETPFGYVHKDDLHVLDKLYSYGDIVPFGDGPDPQMIYQEGGYEYLKRDFPAMSYINSCKVVHYDSEPPMEDEL